MRFQFKLLLVVLLAFSTSIYAKTNRALLVGVSTYHHLAKDYQLDGPKYDADLVKKVLLDRGFKPGNITSLVSSKDDNKATDPTRANILTAFDNLAKVSKPGDFVYLHFAGHGSRQPASAKSNDEADGLDEIFLPADAKKWDKYIGSVVNAITDNEIATYIDKIRSKGADIWVVFDSCHSGSITRGIAEKDVHYRKILGRDLGIPDTVPQTHSRGYDNQQVAEPENNFELSTASTSPARNNVKKGALITFSAAQSDQTTPEMKLPRRQKNGQYHGLFTYTLMDILAKNHGISYQQLAYQVMARYQSTPWRRTTPLMSASDMSAPIFNESSEYTNQWKANRDNDKLTVPAGRLNQFSTGAVIALYESAVSKSVIAEATVTDSQAMQSQARIKPEFNGKALDVKKLPDTVYVRLLTPEIDFQLGVNVVRTRGQSEKDFKELQKAIKQLATDKASKQLVRYQKDSDKASMFVAQFENRIWFVNPDQHLPCEVQYGLSGKQLKQCKATRKPERLVFLDYKKAGEIPVLAKQGLLRIAKARNLLMIQQALSKQDKNLKLDFKVKTARMDKFKTVVGPKLKSGDSVNLKIENTGTNDQAITVLFVDSQYGIQVAYPNPGEPNVIKPKESLELPLEINVETTGHEHLIVLNAPATGVVQSFQFLEQPPLSVATRGASKSRDIATLSPLEQMLAATRSGQSMSRGIKRRDNKASPQSGLNIFSWETVPDK